MAYQGKDRRWYNTLKELEEANQRWEQTQELKKQTQLQQEEARRNERFLRQQERLQREQALEQNNLIREQNRLLEEQVRRERNARLDARQEAVERYLKECEEEEEEERDTYYDRYIKPLMQKANIKNIDDYFVMLYEKYEKPERVDFDKYHIDYIDCELDHRAVLAYCDMGSAAMCSKDPQLKARFYECEKAMKDIRNRIPSQGGLLSAIMNRSEVKRLISEANNIIAVHNQLLEDAKKIEDECQKEYDHRIEQIEWNRIQNFNPYLELALERKSEQSEKYEDGRFGRDYRLKHFNYPPEYETFKAKIIEEENSVSAFDTSSDNDYVPIRRRRRR